MEIAPRISVNEKVRFGKPVITGTRVPVDEDDFRGNLIIIEPGKMRIRKK